MSFLQPLMLWGSLAVGIPVLIHLWNRQKGKVLEWAASRWLLEHAEQQYRGIRIENWMLLAFRCLLILLLAVLLAKPVFDLTYKQSGTSVHLVEPSQMVIAAHRFELDRALKNGEKLVWLTDGFSEIKDLSSRPAQAKLTTRLVQESLKSIENKGSLHLYFTNTQQLATGPPVFLSDSFQLHPVKDSATTANIRFGDIGAVSILVDYQDPLETRTVHAALQALAAVHDFPLVVDDKKKTGRNYDLTFREGIYGPAPLTVQTSELVSSGRLPEFLGEQILEQKGLSEARKPLSQKQLEALFIVSPENAAHSWEEVRKYFFAALLMILIIERVLSLKKSYA